MGDLSVGTEDGGLTAKTPLNGRHDWLFLDEWTTSAAFRDFAKSSIAAMPGQIRLAPGAAFVESRDLLGVPRRRAVARPGGGLGESAEPFL